MPDSDPTDATPDLTRWRADTSGCETRVHLNNAGAALQPAVVHEAVAAHLALERELGGYEAADARAAAIAKVRATVGTLTGAAARNVALAGSSTIAFQQALSAFDFAPGDVILTTRADYASNQIMYLVLARRLGVEIVRAPDLAEGGADPEAVRELIRSHRPKLVSVTWIPTSSGLVQPVEAIGAACREAGVPYLVDACQAIGQMPIDIGAIGCDYLAATARKFLRGPRGIGFLIVSDRALEADAYPLFVDMLGADWSAADDFTLTDTARRFETWEQSCALVLGLGAAAQYALDVGADVTQRRAWALAAYARDRLAGMPGVRMLDRGARRCAIVAAALDGHDANAVKLSLRARGINTSAVVRESAVIDMDAAGVSTAIRISPHYYNTTAEIDAAIDALAELLGL